VWPRRGWGAPPLTREHPEARYRRHAKADHIINQ